MSDNLFSGLGLFGTVALYIVIALGILCMVGCADSGGTVAYVGGPTSEPEEEKSAEQSALERAENVVDQVRVRRNEAHEAARQKGDFSVMFAEVDKILREECGFKPNFLSDVIFEEYLNNTPKVPGKKEKIQNLITFGLEHLAKGTFGEVYAQYNGFLDPILTEYLKISFLYPDAGEGEILERYRESIRAGNADVLFPKD